MRSRRPLQNAAPDFPEGDRVSGGGHARVADVAAGVVAAADAGRRADDVLRERLRRARDLVEEERRLVSHAVFSYYRWLRWSDPQRPIQSRIQHALQLAEAFATRPATFSPEKLLARCLPAWVKGEMEITTDWVRTLQQDPPLWLRARKGQGTQLARRLGHCRAARGSRLADAVWYRGEADLFRSEAFHAGEFEIQDLSSQAVGLACDPQPGETWWDACAGEGGKTLHFSDLMENRGLIWASDRAEWRLRQLKRRAGRARCFNYRTAVWEGGPRLPTRTLFDGVLVDAPCSGVGTWHRNPQARWTTTVEDVRQLAVLQQQLLMHAAAGVKPGGRLVYAVCTLTRAETVEVADAFARSAAEFRPLSLRNPFGEAKAEARLWFLPQETGGNGMFVAAWRRPPPAP